MAQFIMAAPSSENEADLWAEDEVLPAPSGDQGSMWAVQSGDTYVPCDSSERVLPPGVYEAGITPNGYIFQKKDINFDELLALPDSKSEEIIAGIETFWAREEHFRKFKFLWKRGVLLYGSPGSGKTSTVQIVIKNLLEKGGLALIVDSPRIAAYALSILRKIEPDRKIIVILEDIDATMMKYGEPELLALLDGELQIDNVVFMATTNHPEKLPPRIVNRPSRFDVVELVGMPTAEARELYIETKMKFKDPAKVAKWVEATDGYSLAHIKELIVSIEVFEIPFEKAIARLDKMRTAKLSVEDPIFGGVGGNYV